VDYKTIKVSILDFVENSSYGLIESLAEGIAQICLNDPRVQSATVTIDKPGALRFARSVAVEVTRSR
jgi:FolB domain-containing protein